MQTLSPVYFVVTVVLYLIRLDNPFVGHCISASATKNRDSFEAPCNLDSCHLLIPHCRLHFLNPHLTVYHVIVLCNCSVIRCPTAALSAPPASYARARIRVSRTMFTGCINSRQFCKYRKAHTIDRRNRFSSDISFATLRT